MINEEILSHIEDLAKLRFKDDERAMTLERLNEILNYVNRIQEADTEAIEPTYLITENLNELRKDNIESSLDREEVLKNTSEDQYGYFKLLRVID